MCDILFACDIDNTLVSSYRKCQQGDVCIEWRYGKEQGFMPPMAHSLFEPMTKCVQFVPITSRSQKAYHRILWPTEYTPKMAVVANGGLLLRNGGLDLPWLYQSQMGVYDSMEEITRLYQAFRTYPGVSSCSIVDSSYLRIKSEDIPLLSQIQQACKSILQLDMTLAGNELCFTPQGVDKGTAVSRIQQLHQYTCTICAGDSAIDIPMLNQADYAIVPGETLADQLSTPTVFICPGDTRFPDYVMKTVISIAGGGGSLVPH